MMADVVAGRTQPCPACPWRVGNGDRSHAIERKHDAASAAFSGEQGFHTVMACHLNPPETEGACIGYLLSDHAQDNFAVRMMAQDIPWEGLLAQPVELHPTYVEMRAALDAAAGKEA